jgi:hypothetical protein
MPRLESNRVQPETVMSSISSQVSVPIFKAQLSLRSRQLLTAMRRAGRRRPAGLKVVLMQIASSAALK